MLCTVCQRAHPEAVPELMAYMVGILKASAEYEGEAWAAYDVAYGRQAAATNNRNGQKSTPPFLHCVLLARQKGLVVREVFLRLLIM